MADHVTHEIPPVFNEHSRVLILGTFPSPKSREFGFFYGHPQNRFWRILAALFDEPLPETIDEKRDFLFRHHIALWDVVAQCDIEGASDASIRNAQSNNLSRILDAAPIRAIFTTGTKAGELYHRLCEPQTGIAATILPSPSSANARMKLPDLVTTYRQELSSYLKLGINPSPFSAPILDVADVVKLEQSIAASGTSLYTLMHRAGKFLGYETAKLADRIQTQAPQHHAPLHDASQTPLHHTNRTPLHIAILCGHGNNGGDGWVAAHYLADRGYFVEVISSVSAADIKAEPAHTTACELEPLLQDHPNAQVLIDPSSDAVEEILTKADIIIDALLGTGFSGKTIREPFATWITLTNKQRSRTERRTAIIVAADVPSGYSAQSGIAANPCIQANHTVTMITMKTGLAHSNAADYCGTIRVAPLADISSFLN